MLSKHPPHARGDKHLWSQVPGLLVQSAPWWARCLFTHHSVSTRAPVRGMWVSHTHGGSAGKENVLNVHILNS